MANHVYTTMTFDGVKPETVKELQERFDKIDCGDSVGEFFSDAEYTREFFNENVGSKWCTLEDSEFIPENGYVYINTCSAWNHPDMFITRVNEFIAERQEERFTCSVMYDDEVPNFSGAQYWVDGEQFDGYEEDWDEILEAMKVNHKELCEIIEKEENGEELTDEEQERLYDEQSVAVYDTIEEERQRFFEECENQLQ
jgi:predicted heme/steroid binding protein